MSVGGFGSALFIGANVLHVTWPDAPGWIKFAGELTFPAIVTVPLAFLVIIIVSLLDHHNLPANIDVIWNRIHGTAKERMEARRAARFHA